jgi:hypothetical protein
MSSIFFNNTRTKQNKNNNNVMSVVKMFPFLM